MKVSKEMAESLRAAKAIDGTASLDVVFSNTPQPFWRTEWVHGNLNTFLAQTERAIDKFFGACPVLVSEDITDMVPEITVRF